jgi:hypothetical protein
MNRAVVADGSHVDPYFFRLTRPGFTLITRHAARRMA